MSTWTVDRSGVNRGELPSVRENDEHRFYAAPDTAEYVVDELNLSVQRREVAAWRGTLLLMHRHTLECAAIQKNSECDCGALSVQHLDPTKGKQ